MDRRDLQPDAIKHARDLNQRQCGVRARRPPSDCNPDPRTHVLKAALSSVILGILPDNVHVQVCVCVCGHAYMFIRSRRLGRWFVPASGYSRSVLASSFSDW